MIKAIREIFGITNRYIILATPLILFSLCSTLFLAFCSRGNLINILISFFLYALMFSAFISGWFKMIKTAVLGEGDIENPNSLIKEFCAGVGEYFLPTLLACINVFIFITIILVITYFIGMKTIGDTGIQPSAFANAMANTETLKAFLMSLSQEQLTKLNLWNSLILSALSFSYFIIMFYLPVLFFKTKNPIKAFFIGILDLARKHFFKNILIYAVIFGIYFVCSVFSVIVLSNMILHFVITLINFYLIIAVAVGLFYYYYNTYIKVSVGKNIDTFI